MPDETTRSVVLQRIRSAVSPGERVAPLTLQADPSLPFRQATDISQAETLALFEERLRDYDAEVVRVARNGVAELIERILVKRDRPRMVSAAGLDAAWLPAGFGIVIDQELSIRELDSFHGVVTGATLGIAETGTLVLQNVAGQGRRALSLVPDFHLCLVNAADVVATVSQAMARLASTSSLPTTFISGPSATADIEMTRIKGVHGPRFLHVVVVV